MTAADVRLAVLVAVLLLIGSGVSVEDDFDVDLDDPVGQQVIAPGAVLLLLAGSLPLAVRRAAPIAVLVLVAAASLAPAALGYHPAPLPVGVLVALYTVAIERSPLVSGACAVGYVFADVLAAATGVAPRTDDAFYIDFVSVVATVTLGYGVALGRTGARMAEQHAADLARQHEAHTRAAVAQEQARIAREVHDIVAHDVSVIVAQAGAARRVFASQPQAAQQALVSIENVGRDALDGLRRLVGLLRTDREPEHAPQPSIEQLPRLIDQVQRAGLPVDLTIRGRPGPLPATVELNAYRIVQEALTNTLKHAGPTRASVVLTYDDTSLEVEVRDEGRGVAGPASAGYGLIGMQQRVSMLGGELSSGPVDGHGFRVTARLPVPGAVR